VTTKETNKQRLGVTNITTNKFLVISPEVLPQRLLQAGDVVVDPAKMADVPEPIAVTNSVAEHALPGVTVDFFGTGSEHQGFEFLDGSSVIDRHVLEAAPNVLVRKENDLGLPLLVDLVDRLEQWLVGQGDLLVTYVLPPGTNFVTKTFAASVPIIVISPGQGIGLIADPVTDDRLGLQKCIPDLFVDRVIRKKPAQILGLERDELIGDFLEHPLGVKDVEEEPGVIGISMKVERQHLGWIEANRVVECAK
jgi:hypothetical protein